MKPLLMTNEYPPNVYGGAGVHVEYLSRELSKLMPVEVRSFGSQNIEDPKLSVFGTGLDDSGFTCPKGLRSVFGALQRNLGFNTRAIDADLVHCHTWYTHFGGIMAKLNYGIPLVLTVHSLEPLRPWKREQLGGGYDFSSWVERTAIEMADAIIAVSEGTRVDVLKHFHVDPEKIHIIYNGIDPDEYQKVDPTAALEKFGIDPKQPYVLFVGRITRQKGIIYLVNAIRHMNPDFQIVLCAGAPDTPEIAAEMKTAVAEASKNRSGVFWIDEMVDKKTVIQLYSGAEVFCCPSIYEPFGIINLEAMACETAVVGASVGGIPEVVVHDQTGYLVPVAQIHESPFTPLEPEHFSKDIASQINRLMANPERRAAFAKAGRQRAIDTFSWAAIAKETSELYASLVK
ncbi:glycogen synthase [Puniceicoccales bacterium CK1056]|uniref:Glycogen synthase n=1 Tax=Oceanipulchritudo coccoides TaxID=2706888 RepID=A0A6B2M2I0_9BACT|nr:glycogen synthase [Oceanipulchritudo coccoides]NDV62586.1 glycogen synthase [Oceanipulchritudo coccoides]